MSPELTLRAFDLELDHALATAAAEIRTRRGVAIRLRTADGIGVGESTPLPGWTESLQACSNSLAHAADRLQDGEPWQLVLPKDRPAARHGLQLAMMDLAARAAENSLAGYLAERDVREQVPVNATLGNRGRAETLEAVSAAIDAGFRTIKCKVGGRSVEAEVRRVRTVREALPPDVELRLDANRAWTIHEAKQAFAGFEEVDVSYVEEPLVDPTPVDLESLRTAGVGIALDETIAGASELHQWLEVSDVIVLKPMALGGIDRAVELATAARAAGVRIVVSSTIDAVIARTAAVHLAAALPDSEAAGLATGHLLSADLADDPAPVRSGSITVPTDPGLGTLGPWDHSARGETLP